MRARKSRFLTLILSITIAVSNLTPLTVYADETNKQSSNGEVLSDLRITDVDEPEIGKPLDTTAVVRSAEGVTWEVPVVWVDEQGRKVTVPEPGKKYFPTFLFFVPEGYKVYGADASGKFSVKYPDFVSALFGTDHVIFAADPASGITYIFVAGDYNWQQYLRGDYVWSEWHEPEANEPPDPDYDKKAKQHEEYKPEPEVSDPVKMYCSQSAIDTLGEDFLKWFISVVKNTLEPQAVRLLQSHFYGSLGQAIEKEELSEKIGLYIYYKTGEIDGDETLPGAMAYVSGTYRNNAQDQKEYAQVMAFDTSCFTVKDANGKWIINDEKKSDLDNTIVHELMHAFMFDYTRYGMSNERDSFPAWFSEGIAVAVENAYQFRKANFLQMADQDIDDTTYTTQSVVKGYKVDYGKNNEMNLDLSHSSDEDGNTGSAYSAGYLAMVYLGFLGATHNSIEVIDDNGDYIMEAIRIGLDDILRRLHGNGKGPGESLDSIIADISDQAYKSTDDYQKKFIKGAEEDNAGGSLDFVTNYLNWLEGQSYTENGVEKDANGSVLNQEQNYESPLSWEGEYVTNIPYRISNTTGMATSTVDDKRANSTGGKSTVGNGSNDYFQLDDENQAAARKTTEPVMVPQVVADPVTEQLPDQPADTPEISPLKTGGLEESLIPKETAIPEETAVPEETVIPEETAAPEETVIPEETADTEETGTPEETAPPEESAESEESGSPEDA